MNEQKDYEKVREELIKKLEAERQINLLLRKIASQEARERLKNVKLVNPELYYKAVQYLTALVQSGQISTPVKESDVKEILAKLSGTRKELRIIRK